MSRRRGIYRCQSNVRQAFSLYLFIQTLSPHSTKAGTKNIGKQKNTKLGSSSCQNSRRGNLERSPALSPSIFILAELPTPVWWRCYILVNLPAGQTQFKKTTALCCFLKPLYSTVRHFLWIPSFWCHAFFTCVEPINHTFNVAALGTDVAQYSGIQCSQRSDHLLPLPIFYCTTNPSAYKIFLSLNWLIFALSHWMRRYPPETEYNRMHFILLR